MVTDEKYDITQHDQGISACRLKSHEDQHQRQPANVLIKRNNENTRCIDGIIFSCVTDIAEIQTPELPEHLQDLFSQSSVNLVQEQKNKLAELLIKYQDSLQSLRLSMENVQYSNTKLTQQKLHQYANL